MNATWFRKMARKTKATLPFRRKREGKTDYKKRLKLLMSHKPRLVVRKSSKNMLVQVVEYSQKGDKVLVTAHTNELRKLGWKYSGSNIPASYLVGYLAGKKMAAAGIKDAVLDIGLQTKGQRLFAALKGTADAGAIVPYDEKVVPDDARLAGKHTKKDMEQAIKAVKEKIK
jgi:large subunit ribosomal protein L18